MTPAPEKIKKEIDQARWWTPAGQKNLNCNCSVCPTYKGTGESQANFCGINVRSAKITSRKGCICKSCPVALQAGSKDEYCCIVATKTQSMFDTLLGGLK